MTTEAYIRECREGHHVMVSELAMTDSIAEPRCPMVIGERKICGAKLLRKLRPAGVTPHGTDSDA